ncbi:isochorismatase family cysteine hydrolase [Halobacillus amylolyticus]|uniref:Cysteine hydrolase n=1 Tax=Halobacillus amylolyticus TaxID=2932259 RepID=A0ABY4HFI0_9BACI|nr:isochorismatase family cysteine hydrolase [Halobacillus amylolyticus]UOR13384.1 cysteine hydrolase [Halobacillus amylolyticus]
MSQRTALLMIDMINKMDFDGGEDLLENTKAITANLQKLKSMAKQREMPVIYVNDNFGLWQDNKTELIKECKQGRGEPVINEILPEEDDYFIIKPKHSAFFGTQLSILLEQLAVSNLILTGVTGDICVLFTANDAYMRGYDLWVPRDCVASEQGEDNQNALRIIERSLSAKTIKSYDADFDTIFKD